MPPGAIIPIQIRGPGLVGPRQDPVVVDTRDDNVVAEFERTRAVGLLMADSGDDIVELTDRWSTQSNAAWYVAKQTTGDELRKKLGELGNGDRLAILVAQDVAMISDLVDRWSNA